jgi:hypothetical protein
MGTALSTFILLVGTIATGVLSSMSANYAWGSNKDWGKVKMYAGISLGISLLMILLNLFVLVRGHTGASEITGIIEEFAFGVMFSFIVLMISMIVVCVLNVITIIGANSAKPEDSNAFKMAVGAAITSFGSFILSLFLIIFLL